MIDSPVAPNVLKHEVYRGRDLQVAAVDYSCFPGTEILLDVTLDGLSVQAG